MMQKRITFLCFGLFLCALWTQQVIPFSSEARFNMLSGLVLSVPVLVGILVWIDMRWACAVGVMCGTLGLALDISTIIHVSAEPDGLNHGGLWIVLSGLFNFLLIVMGGKGFFNELK